MIKHIDLVMVPVADQDSAIAFWTEKLGFEVRTDTAYEAMGQQQRWVEVAPPGGEAKLALTRPPDGSPPSGEDSASTTSFLTDDLERDHAALRDQGVDVDDIMAMDPPVPPMCFFRDPDGNRFLLVQRD